MGAGRRLRGALPAIAAVRATAATTSAAVGLPLLALLLLAWLWRLGLALRAALVTLPLLPLLLRLSPLASRALAPLGLLVLLRLLRLLAARLAAPRALVCLPGALAALVAQRVLLALGGPPPQRRAGGPALGARAGAALACHALVQHGKLNHGHQPQRAGGGGAAAAAAAAAPPSPAPAGGLWECLGGLQAQHHAAVCDQAQLFKDVCGGREERQGVQKIPGPPACSVVGRICGWWVARLSPAAPRPPPACHVLCFTPTPPTAEAPHARTRGLQKRPAEAQAALRSPRLGAQQHLSPVQRSEQAAPDSPCRGRPGAAGLAGRIRAGACHASHACKALPGRAHHI